MSAQSVIIAIPLGTLLSVLLLRTNVWGRQAAWIAIGSQLAVPLYVFAGGWSAGFGLQGWLTASSFPFAGLAVTAGTGSLVAVSLIHALAAVPWVCLITSLGLMWIHRGQDEMARTEGGLLHLVRYLWIPKLRIWIALSCVWCLLPVLTEMVVTNLYQVPTVAEQVYLDASRGSLSPWTYAAAVLFCMLPIACLGGLVWRWSPPWRDVIVGLAHYRATTLELRQNRLLVSCCAWLVVVALVGLPIVNLIIKAGWQPYVDADGTTQYGWALARWLTTVRESIVLFSSEFYWTSILAVSSTATSLGISILLRALLPSKLATTLVAAGMILLIAVPGPLVGMLAIFLLNRDTPAWLGRLYDGTLAAPILAQQFRMLPLAWLLVLSIQASISRRAEEQAALDGLSWLQTLRFVVYPQTWSRWLVAVLLLLVISVGELSCTILVLPPGVTTISMRLFEMLHFGMRHQDSGLCGVLLLLGWLTSFSAWKTLRER